MKRLILFIMATLLMVGCSHPSKFLKAEQNGKWYEATNEDCPKVEFHINSSITCYDNDMNKLRTIPAIPESHVRAYREALEARREQERNLRQGYDALERRAFNPLAARI